MKKHCLIILLLFLVNTAWGQSNVARAKQAERNYFNYDYPLAASGFEKISDKNTEAKRKLADSYKMTGNMQKAEEYFAAVANAADSKPADIYNYAYILRINGKYEESYSWLEKYGEAAKTDSRVKMVLENKGNEKKITTDDGRFTIKNLLTNSEQQDFSASYYKEKVAHASTNHGIKPALRKWNGNHLSFLNIYISEIDKNGELVNTSSLRKANKHFHEGPVTFSKDGSRMIFTRNNYSKRSSDGVRKLQLFESVSDGSGWTEPVALPFNSKEYSTGHGALSADGNTLYFTSDMPGGRGGTDIYIAKRNKDGLWGKPENMGILINTEGNEMFPFIHESGLFFFSSDGHFGLGGLDVFAVQLKDNIPVKKINAGYPVNSSYDDFAFIVSADSKKGYFTSNRKGGKGDDDIYSFTMLKPFVFGKQIKGVAKDKEGKAISGVTIQLTDEAGNTQSVVTSDDASYSFLTEADKKFTLLGTKEKYTDGKNVASTATDEDIVVANLQLEKDQGLSLYALITDKKTGTPLEGVKITITNKKTGKEEEVKTPATGDYFKPLPANKINDKISYDIRLEKRGYITKNVNYTKTLDRPGRYNIHEELDLSMSQPDLGADLAQLMEINPIYFDLNKYNIREDAAKELDKIVSVMMEFPTLEIELGSHTDCRSSAAYNLKLSDNRAKASAAYIKKKITNPERIYGKGYGESHLVNDCACEGAQKSTCSETEHQKNRRTEFRIKKL